ncbi:MAG: penicillin-binding protein 1B [Pseudomonadota bacterium]
MAGKKAARKKASKKVASKKTATKKSARKAAAKKPVKRRKAPAPSASGKGGGRRWLPWFSALVLLAAVAGILGSAWLDYSIRQQFEGKKWSLPARVYARPLELYAGKTLTARALEEELAVANYRPVGRPDRPGAYSRNGKHFRIHTRDFNYWDGAIESRIVDLRIDAGRVASLESSDGEDALVRLDPAQIAAIYPQHQEDRNLVRLEGVPPSLVHALLLIEDRAFFEHHGVRPLSIARALIANIRAGRTVQGGSTLTQQLIKNYFLTREQTLTRKAIEAWMAVLLEFHYSKPEILEAYLNEVYLGQDGERAIHGFGLAASYYFDTPLKDLGIEQQALLVAMVKGASYYDPRRHPERATRRRNLVIEQLALDGAIEQAEAARLKRRPLGVVDKPKSYRHRYMAFVDLVRRQLQRDYPEEALQSEGLHIFTTLAPGVQARLEMATTNHLGRLEARRGIESESLQSAGLITDTRSGEVLAVAGGRDANDVGFNRALDARRQIGSLAKPAVYLTALRKGDTYTAATLIDDAPFEFTDARGKLWAPKNYSGEHHGEVMLADGLVRSYNVATARLGLELGLDAVADTMNRLGLEVEGPHYPSLLLGAVERSPYQVAQYFQTFAGDGFYTPLRTVREVVTANGERLQRYPMEIEQRLPGREMYLINGLLQAVVERGTAQRIGQTLPALRAAGKTGTTNDGRDAWFAGFSGEHLGVIWVGSDDNRPTALTGSSGALPIWLNVFEHLDSSPYQPRTPSDVEWHWVSSDGRLSAEDCENAVQLPFIKGSEPDKLAECREGFLKRLFDW